MDDAGGCSVANDQVQEVVRVEQSKREGGSIGSIGGDGERGLKRPVALASENGVPLAVAVSSDDVRKAVIIDIGDHHRIGVAHVSRDPLTSVGSGDIVKGSIAAPQINEALTVITLHDIHQA